MNVPQIIELERVDQERGRLAIGELGAGLPFQVRRFFIGYDIPRGTVRGAHAHRELDQLLICIAGCVVVRTSRGARDADVVFLLDRPSRALYIPPMIWAEQEFSPQARLLVLCSAGYDEAEYIRDRAEFDRLALEPA